MAVKIVRIDKHEILGGLLRGWSEDPSSRPGSVEDFKSALTEAGINNEWPDGTDTWFDGSPIPEVTKINYIDLHDDTLTVIVPSAKMIAQGISDSANATDDGTYLLPVKYDNAFIDPTKDYDVSPDKWDELLRARLGDYCITKCM